MVAKRLVVEHHNDLTESIYGYTELELNAFVVLIYKLRDSSENNAIFSIKEIKSLIGKNRSFKRFEEIIDNIFDQKIQIKEGSRRIKEHIFDRIEIDDQENIIEVKIKDKYKPLIYNLGSQFTRYSLLEFISLKSKYSKRIYQLSKQYQYLKQREFEVNDFKALIEAPEKYTFTELNKFIIKKSIEEINKFTTLNLELEITKRINRKVVNFKFNIKRSVYISDKLQEAIDFAKRNIFFSKAYNTKKISIFLDLLETYDEDVIIEALHNLYSKAKVEIKTLKAYIETIIKNSKNEVKYNQKPLFKSFETIISDKNNDEIFPKTDSERIWQQKALDIAQRGKSSEDN